MKNALSIDLEDWFCVHVMREAISKADWKNCELRVVESTRRIMDLLARHGVEATFFVLGWIAERVPELVREIELKGHEIACHGYSHSLITHMTPDELERDLDKALLAIRNCVKSEIIGYRAPSFSIKEETLWAVDILVDHGFVYDSSVFPVSFHPDYGIPNAPLVPYEIGRGLIEFPLSCVEFFGKRIPCGGGGYFRLYPYALTRFLLKRCNAEGRPAIFYLHPWEADPGQPRVSLPVTSRARHYMNIGRTLDRLGQLLTEFEFTSVKKVLSI